MTIMMIWFVLEAWLAQLMLAIKTVDVIRWQKNLDGNTMEETIAINTLPIKKIEEREVLTFWASCEAQSQAVRDTQMLKTSSS